MVCSARSPRCPASPTMTISGARSASAQSTFELRQGSSSTQPGEEAGTRQWPRSSSRTSMPDEPRSWPPPLSRRSLLQGAVGAAGAATIIAASPNCAAAAPKISPKAVNYQDHPDGDKRCDKCVQFQPPNACKVVDGTISPQGSCRTFVPIRQAVRRSSAIPSTT